jgi:hypothetical protein
MKGKCRKDLTIAGHRHLTLKNISAILDTSIDSEKNIVGLLASNPSTGFDTILTFKTIFVFDKVNIKVI